MTDFYVYGYCDPQSDDPFFYIGKGHGDRAWEHTWDSNLFKDETHFYRKLRKMVREGVEPEIKIIENGLSETGSFKLERILISHYGRLDTGTGCLCNHTDGGEGASGYHHTEDSRSDIAYRRQHQIISESATITSANSRTGLKLSDNARRNQGIAARRRWQDPEYRKKMAQRVIFISNAARRNMSLAHTGKSYPRKSGYSCPIRWKPVMSLDPSTGAVLNQYPSIKAAVADGFLQSGISNCLSGRARTHRGFRWIYAPI